MSKARIATLQTGGCSIQCGCDGKQFFYPVTHLVRQHLTGFLGEFPLSHVEEYTEHNPADDALIFSLAASRYPVHLTAVQNTKVDLVGAKFFAGRSESGSNPVGLVRSACTD